MRLWFPKNRGSSEAHGESPQPYQIYTSFLKRKETMMAKKKKEKKKNKNKGKKKGKGKK
jgi:hypothetical protein